MDHECMWQEHAGVRYLRYVVGTDAFAGQRAVGDVVLAEPPGLVRVLVDIRATPRTRPQGGGLASAKALYGRLVERHELRVAVVGVDAWHAPVLRGLSMVSKPPDDGRRHRRAESPRLAAPLTPRRPHPEPPQR